MNMEKKNYSHTGIIQNLRGQTIHVPDLGDIFRGWPMNANVHYEDIIPIVENTFDRLVHMPALREKYRKADYARFISLYYPHPGWDQIQTLARYIIWLFCWDDAIDQQGTSNLSSNLLRAKAHRNNTIRVLEKFLNLTHASSSEAICDHVNDELKAIGEELQKAYSVGKASHSQIRETYRLTRGTEQRQTFMTQMRRYIESCDKEQHLRLHGTLPSMESYKEIRHGTAAVWTLCALIEYGLDENIPEHVRYMGEIQTIWAETSRAIWITNDILSLRKEIPKDDRAAESVVNAVPILMTGGKSAQEAVDCLLSDLAASVASFEAAAKILSEAAGDERRLTIQRYCDACRCMVTGSVRFTFESTRYQLAGCMNADGSLDILL